MTKPNPAQEAFDLESFEELARTVTSSGISWDNLESDPKRYISNYRRICPKKPDWKYPFQVVYVHYAGPSNRMIGCPREMGMGECPLCNHGFSLIRSGAKDEGKDILPSLRVFMNVVRLRENGELADDKVFLLGMNLTSFFGSPTGESEEDEILSDLFREYGDIAHIEYGRNLEIRAKQVKRGRFEFNKLKYAVTDPVPFPGDEALLEQIYDLPGVVPFLDPNEMVDIFEGRSFGALLTSAAPIASLPAPTSPRDAVVILPPNKGGFARRDEEEEVGEDEPAESNEEETVEEPQDRRATARSGSTKAVPKTNPSTAAARLRARLQNGPK